MNRNRLEHVRRNGPVTLIYAGLWVRFLAALLDILVLCASIILLALLIGWAIAYSGIDSVLQNQVAVTAFYGLLACMSVAYFILMESGNEGATIGKRWMNIKVLDENGNRVTRFQALGRFVSLLFTYLPFCIGFLIQPLTERKQTLHDLLANTVVVQENESKKISIMATLLVLFFTFMVPALAFFFTIGLPVYQQYILKSQLGKGVQSGREAAFAVAQFYRNTGRVPAEISEANSNIAPTFHVAGIGINQQNGEVTVTFGATTNKAIRGKHLVFSPTLQGDNSVGWKCHSKDIETRFLPDTCK